MSTVLVRRAGTAGVASLALALLTMQMAPLAAAGPSVLTACVNPGNGNMRLVAPADPCHANETRVQWNVEGPAGPVGPPGPPGSATTGPPYVWICTPANYPLAASNTRADLYVFNGGPTTANVAVHILDKDANNLAGVTIPGSSPAESYPGQTGADTVPVPSGHTKIVTWVTPQTFPDPSTSVSATVRVVSDQPIAVGSNFQFSGFIPLPCSYLHP